MAYFTITDFKFGVDRRRERVAGIPGTLWIGKNIHISRGGDVQRAKKFVALHELPAGTFGAGQLRGQLFVFGSGAEPDGMPAEVQYQRLQASDTDANMVQVLDVDTFDGAFYVIARYDNGEIHHFYDGTRVTHWDTVAAASIDADTLASYLADLIDADAAVSATAVGAVLTIKARTAGTAFTITKDTTDFGGTGDEDITLATIQANRAAVAETRATSILEVLTSIGTVSDITVNGVSLMRAAVDALATTTLTAAAIAVQINNKSVTHGYIATAAGAEITITAAVGTGATPNNHIVAASTLGGMLLATPSVGGGVTAVTALSQIVTATISGTIEAADLFKIVINGIEYTSTVRASATGTSAFVHKKRMWSPANSLWRYSKLLDVADWTDAGASAGAGFLNISNESEGRERLVGAAPYGTQAAVFSRNSVHIYDIDTDASVNAIANTLGNTGSLAARAILAYGNLDVFYLDEPGVRSLKAHSQTGEAYASDIGNAIDPVVREYMDSLTEEKIRRAVSVIGPEGRFWMALDERIFVLSYFPGSKINAWSWYEPGFAVSDFVRVRNKMYARAGDTIYIYGGENGTTYPDDDEMIATVSTAFMTAQTPATIKHLTGFDIACSGQWAAELLVDPNDTAKVQNIGVLHQTTYNSRGQIAVPGESTHMALNLTCSKAGNATISSITIHYEPDEAR